MPVIIPAWAQIFSAGPVGLATEKDTLLENFGLTSEELKLRAEAGLLESWEWGIYDRLIDIEEQLKRIGKGQ